MPLGEMPRPPPTIAVEEERDAMVWVLRLLVGSVDGDEDGR